MFGRSDGSHAMTQANDAGPPTLTKAEDARE